MQHLAELVTSVIEHRAEGKCGRATHALATGPSHETLLDRRIVYLYNRRMVPGTQIGGYRVLHQIGEGGMGSVWLAEHTILGRKAALKVLHPTFSMRADVVQRFFNEARAATAISDAGIVQIFDFGHHIDGSAYIVMELLEGEPLDRRLARLGQLPPADALRIVRQVAKSLGAAHARGIVHRDLKPENIFLVSDPEVASGERAKILDFGIAKLVGDASSKTSTSAVMGTPTYMSPEQCRGAGHVDQRSDVYALGCVLFGLLTGRPPFDAEGVGDIIAMHLREPAPAPSSRAPWVSVAIDQLVLRCLQKDPAHRFVSGTEVAAAIEQLTGVTGMGPIGSSPGLAPTPATTTLSGSAGAARYSVAPEGRRGAVAAVLGVGVLVVVGGVVAMHYSASQSDPAAPTPAPHVLAAAPTVVDSRPPVILDAAPAATPDSLVVVAAMRRVADAFATWAPHHLGAPCPDGAALGVDVRDGSGATMRITCTDQPADQIIGIVSPGPDGSFGTSDDMSSWQIATNTLPLKGPRWVTRDATHTKSSPGHTQPKVKPTPTPTSTPGFDADGLPISR